MHIFCCESNVIEIYFNGSNEQQASVGLDNGFDSNRRDATI